MNDDYNNLLDQCAELMILEDSCSLATFNRHDYIAALSFVPFAALHCREAEEYLKKSFVGIKYKSKVNDLRNVLKFTGDRFGIITKRLMEIDEQQTKSYKPNSILRILNGERYYNLGIYLDKKCNIIFDTYSAILFLGLTKNQTRKIKKYAFDIGRAIGHSIMRICDYFNKNLTFTTNTNTHVRAGYQDINTHDNTVFNTKIDIGTNLLVLHLLSIIGADKYLLSECYDKGASWKYRQQIVCGIAVRNGIEALYQKANGSGMDSLNIENELKHYAEIGHALFPREIRNRMMHYGLKNNNEPAITPEQFDCSVPFFGIIESCFNGESSEHYLQRVNKYVDDVQAMLRSLFTIDPKKTCWDL